MEWVSGLEVTQIGQEVRHEYDGDAGNSVHRATSVGGEDGGLYQSTPEVIPGQRGTVGGTRRRRAATPAGRGNGTKSGGNGAGSPMLQWSCGGWPCHRSGRKPWVRFFRLSRAAPSSGLSVSARSVSSRCTTWTPPSPPICGINKVDHFFTCGTENRKKTSTS